MQAPTIAPGDEGVQLSKNRLSPPAKCSHGTIIPFMDEVMVDIS